MFVFHRTIRALARFCRAVPRGRSAVVAVVEGLEGRALMSVSATGVLQNEYPGADGSPVTTPLAGWQVFDDANRNGVRDGQEAAAVTGLDGSYTLSLSPGVHTVRAADRAGWSTPAGYFSSTPVTLSTSSTDVRLPALTVAMTNPVVIDVAAFTANSDLPWASLIPGYFRQANQVFANSDTNVRINLVGIRAANYTAAGNLSTDLARLSMRGDGYMDTIPTQRDQMGADLAILFDPTYTATAAGLAYLTSASRPDAAYGYGVCCYSGDATFDGYTVAHEIGHLLGADHDADHGPGGTAAYARGYRFTGNDGVLYHDVMAYPPGTTLPFFSSPSLSFAGHALGAAGSADNVRAIRQVAPAVAAYRARAGTAVAGAAVPTRTVVSAVSSTVTKGKVVAGGRVSATTVVRNTSGKKFSGKVVVGYYLSTDRTLDRGDTFLRRTPVQVAALRAEGTIRTTAALTLGAKSRAGAYYVLAVATTTGKAVDERPAPASAAPIRVAAAAVPAAGRKGLAEAFQTARAISAGPVLAGEDEWWRGAAGVGASVFS